VPVRLTVWELFGALSRTINVPVRVPVAVGVKVALMVQLAPAARLGGQLLEGAPKSPLTEIDHMVMAPLPVLVSVRVWGELIVPTGSLPNVRDEGLRTAAAAVPEPLKGAVWGLSGALSATLSCALNVPVVGGVNVRVILQDALTATELPQLLVWAKSPAFVPVMEIPFIVSGALPRL